MFHSDIFVTNCRLEQLLNYTESALERKFAYEKQSKLVADDFQRHFQEESGMQLLFKHLNQCGKKLVKQLYSGKHLTIEGAPVLTWDWSRVRIRGTSGASGSFSKSYGVGQPDFDRKMRLEEERAAVTVPSVPPVRVPSLRQMSLLSPSWDPLMSLVSDMKFWTEPGVASPLKKKTRLEKQSK